MSNPRPTRTPVLLSGKTKHITLRQADELPLVDAAVQHHRDNGPNKTMNRGRLIREVALGFAAEPEAWRRVYEVARKKKCSAMTVIAALLQRIEDEYDANGDPING